MKAVVCTKYGEPDVLEIREVDKPEPGDNEVRVKVHATTVHVGDTRIRAFRVPTAAWVFARLALGVRRPKHEILGMVAALQPEDPTEMQAASRAIRGWFAGSSLSPELAAALREAYATLGQPPVAVRSSATAEDLPELSFAGQQDTFLHVIGAEALLEAVVRCWSSLWTARAIGYRARYGFPHGEVALAVVVQEMVPAEASGVLFTANPLTGVRTQTVIDATLGLGEALVSGQVEPDHYVVDTAKGEILEKRLGSKAIAIRGAEAGGVTATRQAAAQRQALSLIHI